MTSEEDELLQSGKRSLTQIVRIASALFDLMLWSCALGATTMKFPIKEADFPAIDTPLYWLDNTHVVFRGFTGEEGVPGKDFHFLNEGAYVWDLDQGTVTREPRFDRATDICIHESYLSYIEYTEDKKSAKRRAYENGKEIALPEKFWFNPKSCRVHTTKPAWEIEERATVPLLEEHGYIDYESKKEAVFGEFPLQYYRQGVAHPIPVGLKSRYVSGLVRYAPFLDAYVLVSSSGRLSAQPLWILHPDGTVEEIFSPEGKAWAEQQWSWVEVTKRGLIYGKITYRGTEVRDSGLYLWENETLTQVEKGVFTGPVVSPDGCRLAIIGHRLERPLPNDQLFRLQIINLCHGA